MAKKRKAPRKHAHHTAPRKRATPAAATTAPPPAPQAKASDVMDRRMAAIAMQKSQAGETPSAQELAALRRIERTQEESQRWQYYSSIPQAHYVKMSGRQPKILAAQAERYSLPFGGATIDLPALAKALHDFLADNAHNLCRAGAAIPMSGPIADDTARALTDASDPLAVARAAMQLASRRLADGSSRSLLSATAFEDLKKALQEMRQMEADQLDLAERRAQLIPRDTVKELVGGAATRLVQCLTNLENAFGSEFAVWLADPTMAALPADERARKVREFVARTCAEVRRQESAGVEALLAQHEAAKKEEEG